MFSSRTFSLIQFAHFFFTIFLAFWGPGYIHPDEYFQGSEVIAGDFLGIDVLRTWEFDSNNPVRSMAAIRFAELPLICVVQLYRLFGSDPSANALFLTQRVEGVLRWLLITTFTRIIRNNNSKHTLKSSERPWSTNDQIQMTGELFEQASLVPLVFILRGFSNSTETVFFSFLLLCIDGLGVTLIPYSLNELDGNDSLISSILGSQLFTFVLVAATFSRFTFPIFALPMLFRIFQLVQQRQNSLRRTLSFFGPMAMSMLCWSVAFIAYDSWYFSRTLTSSYFSRLRSISSKPVLSPLNALLYNFKPSNLSEHGLHPRWLHLIVNTPLLFGLPIVAFLWYKLVDRFFSSSQSSLKRESASSKKKRSDSKPSRTWSFLAIMFPLLVLSIQPHQEPRFLLPLLPPILLVFNQEFFKSQMSISKKKIFIYLLFAQHFILAVFFSFFHQGGLIPSLLKLNKDLTYLQYCGYGGPESYVGSKYCNKSEATWYDRSLVNPNAEVEVDLVYWRTFMPPRSLVLPPPKPNLKAKVIDKGSLPVKDLIQSFSSSLTSDPSTQILLTAPSWAFKSFDDEIQAGESYELQTETVYSYSFHLDTDHIGEMVELWNLGKGLRSATSLEVRKVRKSITL